MDPRRVTGPAAVPLGRIWSAALQLERRCWCRARKLERGGRGVVCQAAGAPHGGGQGKRTGTFTSRACVGGPVLSKRRAKAGAI